MGQRVGEWCMAQAAWWLCQRWPLRVITAWWVPIWIGLYLFWKQTWGQR